MSGLFLRLRAVLQCFLCIVHITGGDVECRATHGLVLLQVLRSGSQCDIVDLLGAVRLFYYDAEGLTGDGSDIQIYVTRPFSGLQGIDSRGVELCLTNERIVRQTVDT